jgi:CheY-like chemotaxis protein
MARKKSGARILCVDDEPRVLEGMLPHLRHFEVQMATSGAAGLAQLEAAPFALVISDMRMPQMNGAEFLKQVRERWPHTVRVLLTGYADMQSAISAINEGQIFRFLTKPCAPDVLLSTVNAAVEQNRLVTAEKELLEKTLMGRVQMLCDILSLTHPVAFGRANRIKTHVVTLMEALGQVDRWHVEVASMLVEIGAITLSDATLEKVQAGQPLSPEEQKAVDGLPLVARKILGSIPRLEPVLEVMADVGTPAPKTSGGRALRIALDFDSLESRGMSKAEALGAMRARPDRYEQELLGKFSVLIGVPNGQTIREIKLSEVEVGMTFVDDVRTRTGGLLVARGYLATESFVARVKNMSADQVLGPVRVR